MMLKYTRILEHKSSKYPPRTFYNASRADLTLAIALDFNTAGEKLTRKAAGDKYLAIPYTTSVAEAASILNLEIIQREVRVLNIAGNGIYTFNKRNITQRMINYHLYKILISNRLDYKIDFIVSGGQTGIDFAAGVVAEFLGVRCEMTLPNGFIQRYDATDTPMSEVLLADRIQEQVSDLMNDLTDE